MCWYHGAPPSGLWLRGTSATTSSVSPVLVWAQDHPVHQVAIFLFLSPALPKVQSGYAADWRPPKNDDRKTTGDRATGRGAGDPARGSKGGRAASKKAWRPGGPLAQLTSQRRCGRAVCAGTSVEVQFWEQSSGTSYQEHGHEGVRRLCGERGPQLRSFRTCPPFRRQPLRQSPMTSPPMLMGEIEVTSLMGAVQGTWTRSCPSGVFFLKTNTVYKVQVVASWHQTSACLRTIFNADRPSPRHRERCGCPSCGQHLAVKVAWRCHSHSDDGRGNIFNNFSRVFSLFFAHLEPLGIAVSLAISCCCGNMVARRSSGVMWKYRVDPPTHLSVISSHTRHRVSPQDMMILCVTSHETSRSQAVCSITPLRETQRPPGLLDHKSSRSCVFQAMSKSSQTRPKVFTFRGLW